MAKGVDPNPRKNLLKAGPFSYMNFMPEQLIYDKELQGLVRFRAMFEMPNWDGVENDEFLYIISSSEERLDKIAARFWGIDRQELYWVIAARNRLDLPDVELYKGRSIKIPSRSWIDTYLLPQTQDYIER
jgi:hypothetical protein